MFISRFLRAKSHIGTGNSDRTGQSFKKSVDGKKQAAACTALLSRSTGSCASARPAPPGGCKPAFDENAKKILAEYRERMAKRNNDAS
jgi:hypothetical protein